MSALHLKSGSPFVLFLFILMISCTESFSQLHVIKGTIIDSASLEPVPFATVYIDPGTGTIADEQGFFQLQIFPDKLNDTLKITCIGYSGKNISPDKINFFQNNTIFLKKNIYELNSVFIKAKGHRIQKPEKIISQAIKLIPDNYSDKPVIYKGYYREYLKDKNDFVNLFESILNFEDYGIALAYNFNANLEFKRLNKDFRFDSSLFRPYDNLEKYVPLAKVILQGKNELAVLKSTDPIKNKFGYSVSHINNFRKGFLYNHDFNIARLTYLNDHPYYAISFKDNVNYTIGIERINMSGTIYIDAENFGVKKLNYLATLHSSGKTKKLYELNVEYSLLDGKYYLKYISYNNLFKSSSFNFKGASFSEDTLELTFNHDIDLHDFSPDNIKVKYFDRDQSIEFVDVKTNKLLLLFSAESSVSKDLKNNTGSFLNMKYKNRNDEILSGLSIEFNGVTDNYGNQLSLKPFQEYYQYREFFVHETFTNDTSLTENIIDISKPVFESEPVNGGRESNIAWFNTPLINETTEILNREIQNSRFKTFINNLNEKNELEPEEIVYIHSDREVYNPGDTLWFKAYVRNKSLLTPSFLSKSFFIQLIDSAGEIILTDKFLIRGSDVTGQQLFPMSLKEGYYTLIGYTSWMKNYSPENVFRKQLLVQKEIRDGTKLQIAFDKNEYFPGDSVNFSVSCSDEYNLNVDNAQFDFVIKENKQELFKGEGITSKNPPASFSFQLPKKIQSLPVIHIKASYKDDRMDISTIVPVNYFLLVDFFPEGGHCLDNIKTNIAFKAVTRNGFPVDITGEIMDKTGKIYQKVSSKHEGMGRFDIRFSNKDSLFLLILEPETFRGTRFYLPQCRLEGWQLSVDNKNDKINIEIDNKDINNDTALLILTVRESLKYYKVITNDKNYNFSIQTTDLPKGIAVVTLFDRNIMPQAERLVYTYDPAKYKTTMATDKNSYKPRDSVILKIKLPEEIPDPDKGSWSLSVTDNQLCMTDVLDENDISASLLLSPEIKGSIYHLNSYLSPANDKTFSDIDLLLMTQGWRDYTLFDSLTPKSLLNKEIISGYLFKQPFGQNRQPSKGSVSVYFNGLSTKIEVISDGHFSFLPAYDEHNNTGLFLSATDENNISQVSIALDDDPFQDKLNKFLILLTDSLNNITLPFISTYTVFNNYYSFNDLNHHWLEEVAIIKTVKKKDFQLTDLAMSRKTADKEELEEAFSMEDLWRTVDPNHFERVKPYYCIDGVLQTSMIPPPSLYPQGIQKQSVFDKIPDYTRALHINPKDISEYTIVKGSDTWVFGSGIEYVIDIKLKPINERETYRLWENSLSIKKFSVAKEFYKPVYDTDERRYSQVPDLRKTIHWDPDVQFERDGNAVIKFYNGDRYTHIKCIFEGLGVKGVPVHSEYTYDVDNN